MTTIKDVARASGVSVSTASYALNNGPRALPATTRARVLEAAQRLGYHPSAVARGLQRGRMDTLGIVFSNAESSPISSPYFAPILEGITAAAAERHQNVMLFTGQRWADGARSLSVFCDGRCDGLVLVGPHTQTDIIPSLLAQRVPFVLINNRWPDAGWVDVDDEAAAEELTGHLLAYGHRRLAFLCGEAHIGCVERRLEGCRRAVTEWGLPPESLETLPGSFAEPSTKERIGALLARPPGHRPTALICANDVIALDAVQNLTERGVRVPADVSVTGFDDIAPAAASEPPLTTMHQPFPVLGERAVEILLTLRDGGEAEPALLPATLIVRASTAPPGS